MPLQWKKVKSERYISLRKKKKEEEIVTMRASVPGGWLVFATMANSQGVAQPALTFVPDPERLWNP